MTALAARAAHTPRGPRLAGTKPTVTKPRLARRLYTYGEVAEICAITTRTVQEALVQRELTAVQAPGTKGKRGRRITAASLESYLAKQTQPVRRRRRSHQ